MKFTYMLAGYEGSCHDARMLDETIAFHGFPIPPPGKLIYQIITVLIFFNNLVKKYWICLDNAMFNLYEILT